MEDTPRCTERVEADGWVRLEDCPAVAWTVPPSPERHAGSARDEARERLRGYGLGVPPGATLRDVEIVQYDVWGEAHTRRTRGVVFPRRPGEPAFALVDSWVPWPVHALGPVVDAAGECERGVAVRARAVELRERIERRRAAAEAATDETVDDSEGGSFAEDFDAEQAAWDEVRRTCPWIAWPLLDDLGHHELAERTASDATADALVRAGVFEPDVFERALTHYMQGLDVIARAELEVLSRESVESAADLWRRSRESTQDDPSEREPHPTNLLTFRAELERRANAGPIPEPEVPEEGSDFVAWRTAGRLGVRFSLGWSTERRDAAIAEVRRRLARHPDPSVQPLPETAR